MSASSKNYPKVTARISRLSSDCRRLSPGADPILKKGRLQSRHSTETVGQRKMSLVDLARKHVWWMSPDEALKNPNRVIASVMSRGTLNDWIELQKLKTDDDLREVLRCAQTGWFTAKAWNFWHIVLNHCRPEDVPPRPTRPFPPGIHYEAHDSFSSRF